MHIRDLTPNDHSEINQVAEMLVDAFHEHWPDAFETLEDAVREVNESFTDGRISRIAVDDDGVVLGWIGAQLSYSEVWELHPLVVRVDQQGKGVGRALVADLEERVRERGALTLMLGSDDQDDMTTLSGVDLYQNTGQQIDNIRNLRGHPYEFYQKLGYTIIGVMPDANGIGKPDILMAKRL
ncbi:MAG: GNAT family N-acetyltransferase [Burkholderiales bacterium]|nr:GNAT family N-acetyltransferase [Anaerolineae bacterium]